jgi:hypothetical protein
VVDDLNNQTRSANFDHPTTYGTASPIADHDHLTGSDASHDDGVSTFIAGERDVGSWHRQRIGEVVQEKKRIRQF